jgi:DNA polymerase III subunit delta'
MTGKEIIGHKDITQRLQQAIVTRHVASAYLFAGPEGVGKKLVAEQLAQGLNCQEMAGSGQPCQLCASCRKIKNAQHPDVKVIVREEDAANIKIDQVKNMQADIMLRPHEGRVKVYIIDEAHALTADAANCLLKTLEEPPLDSVLVLVTSKPEALLPTILSRCQRINFPALSVPALAAHLRRTANLGQEEAEFIADLSGGSISLAEEYAASGIMEKRQELQDFISALPGQSLDEVLTAAGRYARDKEEAKTTLDLLLHECRRKYMEELRGGKPEAGKAELLDLIMEAKRNVFRNINMRLTLETIFLRIKNA